jgi:hypothetical protein
MRNWIDFSTYTTYKGVFISFELFPQIKGINRDNILYELTTILMNF